MPDELDDCLGETGRRITESDQSDLIGDHVYLTKGACLSICVNFMCNLANIKMATDEEHLEVAQWVQGKKDWKERIDLLVAHAGLREIDSCKGQLITDEIYLTQFLRKVSSKPSFNVFGFFDTQRNKGHALLFYTWADDDWILYDPNFGMARWTHLGGLMVGMKKLLRTVYSRKFGPYIPYIVYKYEK